MPRPSWIATIIPVVVVSAAPFAGCGGAGSERVTAAELVQKGDAICAEERSSFARIQAHPPPNAQIAADQTGELVEATESATAKLRELKPPEELQGAYDGYLDARERAADQMKRGADAAKDRDSAGYGAAQAAVARDAPQRRKLAAALGLKVCSSTRASA